MLSLPISHVTQRKQSDCLAACAAMALKHIGVAISYDGLVDRLRIGPAGAPFRNLQFLEPLGVSVLINRGGMEVLKTCLNDGFPVIAFVVTQELSYWSDATGHAVVVMGIDETHVYLNDPAFADAPKRVEIGEFDLAWLGMNDHYALIKPTRPSRGWARLPRAG